jgi:hypothetical protein
MVETTMWDRKDGWGKGMDLLLIWVIDLVCLAEPDRQYHHELLHYFVRSKSG